MRRVTPPQGRQAGGGTHAPCTSSSSLRFGLLITNCVTRVTTTHARRYRCHRRMNHCGLQNRTKAITGSQIGHPPLSHGLLGKKRLRYRTELIDRDVVACVCGNLLPNTHARFSIRETRFSVRNVRSPLTYMHTPQLRIASTRTCTPASRTDTLQQSIRCGTWSAGLHGRLHTNAPAHTHVRTTDGSQLRKRLETRMADMTTMRGTTR